MRQRTKARQVALQFLYQFDLRGEEILAQKEKFIAEYSENPTIEAYARLLIDGCLTYWQFITEKIASVAENWTIGRMAVIDRTVLRIAIYELLYRKEVPARVVINEAIELGKRFSTNQSGGFINGILDNLVVNDPAHKGRSLKK